MTTRTDFWSSVYATTAIQRIRDRVRLFWATNVYHYYHRHDGRLGRSCDVVVRGHSVVVVMPPMIDPETGYNYSHAIRKGIPAGRGAYDPELGKRTHRGWYPGADNQRRWASWMAAFIPECRMIIRTEIRQAAYLFVRSEVKRANI